MDWFRVHPVRLLADVRRHSLTLEEQGFILQLCAHVALFDGALQRDSESLRAEMRPVMARKKFDALWARVSSVALSYVAEVDAQAEECAKKSTSRRGAAHARWSRTDDANADANASTNGNANAHAIADAEEKRREEKRTPQPPKGADVPVWFSSFWQEYPNRVGKGAALKAWQKLNPDEATVEAIFAALKWQRHQDAWTKDGGKFIPHPSTWLNARRWEDERPSRAVEKPLPIVDWANV